MIKDGSLKTGHQYSVVCSPRSGSFIEINVMSHKSTDYIFTSWSRPKTQSRSLSLPQIFFSSVPYWIGPILIAIDTMKRRSKFHVILKHGPKTFLWASLLCPFLHCECVVGGSSPSRGSSPSWPHPLGYIVETQIVTCECVLEMHSDYVAVLPFLYTLQYQQLSGGFKYIR